MKKTYEIGGKTYTLKASLYTQIAYKAQFGHDLLGDLSKADNLIISDDRDKQSDGYLIYLQALYILADEGTEGLPPFAEWLKSIDYADIGNVISTVSKLYLSTIKPDRKNE